MQYRWTFYVLFPMLCLVGPVCTQAQWEPRDVHDLWQHYRDDRITEKFFKHRDLMPILREYASVPGFEVSLAGRSFEDREIMLVRIGDGPRKVLMWSQMHGDEPTATMALLDMFRFFASSDSLDTWKKSILREVSIYILPLLNPDGAEVYKRRNAIDIDLNRDALKLNSPESVILKRVRDELKPEFGFNLHDQSNYYLAGSGNEPATISFLAPAYEETSDSLNDVRANAMRLIVQLKRVLDRHVPGKVARYDDAFEPRAFGDNMQKWGTSTILIESGRYPMDPHKQYNRHLHFCLFLSALESIAAKKYLYEGLYDYDKIPYNERRAHDLIIRNLPYIYKNSSPAVDIAWQRSEYLYDNYRKSYARGTVSDMGDLSTQSGFDELDASGYELQSGKLYKEDWRKLQEERVIDLIEQGYTHVLVKDSMPLEGRIRTPLQFLLHQKDFRNDILIGRNPAFLLKKDGGVLLVQNGFLYSIEDLRTALGDMRIRDLYQASR